MEFEDQLQRKVILKKTPQRIISLVPSQTELLVDLGLQENLVGITKFCVHPIDLKKIKPLVGGTKQVKLEKIKSLDPEIILCNKEENTKDMVAELKEVAPIHVSDIVNTQDAFELMRQYGKIFNKTELVETMVSVLVKEMAALKEQLREKPERKVAYIIWKRPLMVAGKDTFIDDLLRLNKFENVFTESRYPVTSLEELKEKSPDLVLLSSEPYPFKKKHKDYFSVLNTEIQLVDGEFFSWYGSRLIKAMDYFKQLRV